MHKYEGFKLICEKCGSEDVYVAQGSASWEIKLVCNNYPVCGQEKVILELMDVLYSE
jgi:ssDNA-binding Zn-finger/Zn-ribbon topoisomerase 1